MTKNVYTYFLFRNSQNKYILDSQHLIILDREEDKTAASFKLDNTRQH